MKGLLPIAAAASLATGSAFAHHPAASYAAIEVAWSYDPPVVPLGLSAPLYLAGMPCLWRWAGPGRGVRYGQAASFWAGWTLVTLALVSPLHWLGEHLFTARMIKHDSRAGGRLRMRGAHA
jgi:putative membrane protein